MTTDPEAATGFYTRLTGWSTAPFEASGGQPYTLWIRGEAPLGGLMTLPEPAREAGAPPHWMPYIYTSDVEGTAGQASELGGSVAVPPTEIPDVGTFSLRACRSPGGLVHRLCPAPGPAWGGPCP